MTNTGNYGLDELKTRADKETEAARSLYKYIQLTTSLREAKQLVDEIKEELDAINLDFSALG